MNWFDIAIIAAYLSSAFIGFKIGVLRAAIVSGAFIVATVVGARGSIVFALFLKRFFENPDFAYITSFIAAFALAFFCLIFVGMALYRAVKVTPLGWIDSWIGSILGFLAGVVMVGLAIVYLTKYPTSNSEEWLKGSFMVSIVKAIISPLFQEFLEKSGAVAPVVASAL